MNKEILLKNWGPCLAEFILEKNQIEQINKLCSKDASKDFRKSLAGQLEHEYKIDHNKLEEILRTELEAYKFAYKQHHGNALRDNQKIKVVSAWVNYMQAGDFNPPHIHHSCDLSAVLYLDIPQKLKDENKNDISNGGGPGDIVFFLSGSAGDMVNQHQIFPRDYSMFIFPFNLTHLVNPYKSKVERVSVAFNMIWEEIKNKK